MVPGAIAALALLIVFSLIVPDAAAQTARPLVTKERYETMPFSAGSIVIPMDEKQNDTVKAFGLVHALLRNGTACYRLIGPPDPTIPTEQFPLGANYSGGPLVISGTNMTGIQPVLDAFPSVITHNVTKLFISTRVYKIEEPTRVLVVDREDDNIYENSFTTGLLASMKIPYKKITIWDLQWLVVNNPDYNPVTENDLVIIEDLGAVTLSPTFKLFIKESVTNGKNVVMIGKSMTILNSIFSGSVTTYSPPSQLAFKATFTSTGESPSQYSGPTTINVTASDVVAMTPGYEELQPMLYSEGYGGLILFASYFRYGKGTVEIFSFYPQDQTDIMKSLASIFLGNRFVQSPPAPLQPPPPLGANGMPLPAGTVPRPPPPPPPPPPSVPMATTVPAQYLFAGFAGIALGDRMKSRVKPKIGIRHKIKVRA